MNERTYRYRKKVADVLMWMDGWMEVNARGVSAIFDPHTATELSVAWHSAARHRQAGISQLRNAGGYIITTEFTVSIQTDEGPI
jgi:hypothetical protein